MASSIPIILLLVIALASQYECAPSDSTDSTVSTTDFTGICASELQTAINPFMTWDFGLMMQSPKNGAALFRCGIKALCKWALEWLDSVEMMVGQFLNSGKPGVTVKP